MNALNWVREELPILDTPHVCISCKGLQMSCSLRASFSEWLGYEWSDKNKQRTKLQPGIGTESSPTTFHYNQRVSDTKICDNLRRALRYYRMWLTVLRSIFSMVDAFDYYE
jgi:hypothetical protein